MDIESPPGGAAFGHPGMPPRWTSSTKDGIGTAYSTASHVWFAISHGIINEIYYPTIDRPQVRDMQFLLADGGDLFQEERRHLVTEVTGFDDGVLGFRIVNADPRGRHRIVKEVIADPHLPCVLVRARLEGAAEWLARLHVYALLAPHLEVGGWGNSARVGRSGANTVLLAWKGSTWLAMGSSVGFARASCGYVGFSDGWQDLSAHRRLEWTFEEALDGNVAVVGEIGAPADHEFTIGIAFGHSQVAAMTRLAQSLAVPYAVSRQRFIDQWKRVSAGLPSLAAASHDGGRLYHASRNVLLAHEDKTFSGAVIASASIPWGQTRGDEDLGGYHLVWTRDMVQAVTGLLASGHTPTAVRALVYLACLQRSDGGFPQNFWIDGEPYWSGVQIDEVAFPVVLAWRLRQAGVLAEFDAYPMIKAAAAFLLTTGPWTGQERWEECSGYSPSTLAIVVAAFVCAAESAASRGETDVRDYLLDYADFIESHIERWTVTTDGALVPGIPRHYIRVAPAANETHFADAHPNDGVVILNSQPPNEPWQFAAKDIVDAGFLELVRYGVRCADDALIRDSLAVVDAVLKVETPYGPCWRRYNHDGYGPHPDGSAYERWGQGRAWPLLVGERAHYELAAGHPVDHLVKAMEAFASSGGLLPEQVWDAPDLPSAGMYLGRTSGSAMPLVWAHAEYVKLLRSRADGRVFDLIPIVADRYRSGRGRRDLEVWKPNRQVPSVNVGQTLRIQAPGPFVLQWTVDEWRTATRTASTPTGLGVAFVDLPVAAGQAAPIRFTFLSPETQSSQSADYVVLVDPAVAPR